MEGMPNGGQAGVPLLAAHGICKRYGELLANDHVDLVIAPGEIHALLGENGAGKSTLVKILYGLVTPDSGSVAWQGEPLVLSGPAEARGRGIAMVFQHFSLFDALNVTENIALALPREPISALAERVRAVSRSYGLDLEPYREVWRLSVGERQRIEIVRCLMQNPKLLILDEPTSVLSPTETAGLFATLQQIRSEGRSVLYISHKLEEVRSLCRKATVLRQGQVVGACDPSQESAASLARLMVGEDIHAVAAKPHRGDGAVRFDIRDLSLAAIDAHGTSLAGINLQVRAGEIVGIAGVAGNGQEELFAALSGERKVAADAIAIDGMPAGAASIDQRRKAGAAFIPEERLGHGAAPSFSLSENILVSRHGVGQEVRHGLVDQARLKQRLASVRQAFDVRASAEDPPARALSGGNLQKFIVGRDLLETPRLVVVAQPTWGVDASAAAFLRQRLIDLAEGGTAILVISQDLDELFEISDRIAVLSRGHLSAALPVAEQTRQGIGLMMGEAAGEVHAPHP